MIQTLKAVIIKTFPYKESSFIVKAYTDNEGLKSFIVKGGRKKGAKTKISVFQPLQILDITYYPNKNNSLCQVKECYFSCNLSDMRSDIVKTSLCLFISEVLNLSLKEDNPNSSVFCFVKNSIEFINSSQREYLKDFHLYFLYQFAVLSGLQPRNNYSVTENKFFDIVKGEFSSYNETSSCGEEVSVLINQYFESCKSEYIPFTQHLQQRQEILNVMILFFEEHITDNKKFQSQVILHALLS